MHRKDLNSLFPQWNDKIYTSVILVTQCVGSTNKQTNLRFLGPFRSSCSLFKASFTLSLALLRSFFTLIVIMLFWLWLRLKHFSAHLWLSSTKLGHRIFWISLIFAHQLLIQTLKASSNKSPAEQKQTHLTCFGRKTIVVLITLFPVDNMS